jgi:hypothetical protein
LLEGLVVVPTEEEPVRRIASFAFEVLPLEDVCSLQERRLLDITEDTLVVVSLSDGCTELRLSLANGLCRRRAREAAFRRLVRSLR